MSEHAPVAEARPGHNKPPVSAPFETDLLDDLRTRYPKFETRYDELMASAAKIPDKIEGDENAGKVQELLRDMAEWLRRSKADRSVEKGPWQKLADTAYNFFKIKEDALTPVQKSIQARHTDFLERKRDAEELERQRLAEQKRQEADRAKFLADWAEAEIELSQWEKDAAEKREAEAIERAAKLKEDQLWAEALAELAEYNERKALEAQKVRELQMAAQRKADKKLLTNLNREADKLAVKDKAETITDEERERYKELIGQGGLIPALQAKLAGDRSHLSAEEIAELEEEGANLARLRQERIDNHAAAEKAKADREKAQREARAASKDANEAAADLKGNTREATQLAKEATKLDARAGRAERQVENATDADLSRTRSGLGTVGSLSQRWDYVIENRDQLVKYFGPLGIYLMADAMDAAVYRYKMQHQAQWTVTPMRTEIPGVYFENVPEGRVR